MSTRLIVPVAILLGSVQCPDAAAIELDALKAASREQSPAVLIPRSTWLNRDGINAASLSPDGARLAYWVRHQKTVSVWISDTRSSETRRLFVTRRIASIGWSADSQYIFMQTDTGVAVTGIEPDSRPVQVINLDAGKNQFFYGIDGGSAHHFFVSMAGDDDAQHTLYRVAPDGSKAVLYQSDTRLYDFLAPNGGAVQFVRHANGLRHNFYRVRDGREERLFECDYEDTCELRGYSPASDTLFVSGRFGHDTTRLVGINGDEISPVLQEPQDRFDIGEIVFDQASGQPLLASYQTEFRHNVGATEGIQNHLDSIESAIDSRILDVHPGKGDIWLVVDRDPRWRNPAIHLYDRETRTLRQPLATIDTEPASTLNSLLEENLSLRESFWYAASDGMQLQGYLTLPRGLDAASVPLVVVPHGGPWSRTDGDFSTQAQFLANRGYAVFQPNFRASTGFGRRYVLSANRDFGRGRVHKDIIDGVDYLLRRGIGDKDRLAIVGHSFGGFSALGALAFEPTRFRVGVATAAPAALSKAVRHYFDQDDFDGSGFRRLDIMARLAVDIRDPEDVRRSYELSPEYHAADIVSPVYLWAGEQDERVNILDVRDYALKLEKLSKDVTLLSAPGEGHGPRGDIATDAFFYMTELALHRHLGGRIDDTVSSSLRRYLDRNLVMGKL